MYRNTAVCLKSIFGYSAKNVRHYNNHVLSDGEIYFHDLHSAGIPQYSNDVLYNSRIPKIVFGGKDSYINDELLHYSHLHFETRKRKLI